MTTPPDPVEIAKQAREHAWNWFALHATQRMQAFNFFVVATAFLIAAYASLLDKEPAAAAVLAIVGAWLAFWFNRRSRVGRTSSPQALRPHVLTSSKRSRREPTGEHNEARPHQGRWCFGKTPMQTFLDALPMTKEKMIAA